MRRGRRDACRAPGRRRGGSTATPRRHPPACAPTTSSHPPRAPIEPRTSACPPQIYARAVSSGVAGRARLSRRLARGRPASRDAPRRPAGRPATRPATPEIGPAASRKPAGRPAGRPAKTGWPTGWPAGRPTALTTLWNVRAARNRAQGGYFCPFFCGRPERCTFPTAPWPAAAPTTSPAPPAAKTHHLPGTGSYPPSQLTPSAAHAVSLSQAGHKKKRCWKDAGGIGASLTRLCRRLWRRQSHRRLPGPISVQLQHAGSGDPQHLRYVLVCSCSTGAADGAWALWEGERTLGVEPPPPPHPPSRAHVCVL